MQENLQIGRAIKFFRTQKNLTRSDLCGSVVSERNLLNIESQKNLPKIDTLDYFSRQLKIPINHFFLFEHREDYQLFYSQRFQIFSAVKNNEISKLKKIEKLIEKLSNISLPTENQFVIEVYQLIFYDAYAALELAPYPPDFEKKILAITHYFELSMTSFSNDWLIFISLFFKHHPDPMQSLFYQKIINSPAFNNDPTIVYQINTTLIRSKCWYDIVDITKDHLKQNSALVPINVLALLHGQISIAYKEINHINLAAEHEEASLVLRKFYDSCPIGVWYEKLAVPKYEHVISVKPD